MSHVKVHEDDVNLQNPVFVEGLPGLGLVGKIATDHLIDQFDMTYYASIECPSLPAVASYRGKNHETLPAVRIYANERHDLLALQADVAVSPQIVSDFASCLVNFLIEEQAVPITTSGLARSDDTDPEVDRSLYGIATGAGQRLLTDQGIDPPIEEGVWWGPTGAILDLARKRTLTSVGLIVETDPEFPDPEAACLLLEAGIGPISGTAIDVGPLRKRAAKIREEKKSLADQMRESDSNESSKAESLRMYQ